MTEPLENLTPQEMLERIIQLESRLAFIEKQEIKSLKVQVGDLQRAVKAEITNVTTHVCYIHDLLWPVLRKVFPGSVKAEAQITAIIGNDSSAE